MLPSRQLSVQGRERRCWGWCRGSWRKGCVGWFFI